MAKEQKWSKHHRKPRSIGGKNNPENISMVPVREHRLWHAQFYNMTAEETFNQINRVWFDPAYTIILVKNYDHK